MAGNGGARPGAGRPKGSVNQRTLERMAMKRHFVERVLKNTDRLFNAQLNKAIGEQFLFVKITEGEGKNRRVHTEMITSPDTIIQYLNGELDDDNENEYYYLSTKPSDNMAIANMLDRAYGKPTEKVELGGADDGDLSEVSDEELNARIDNYLKRRSGS